MKSPFPGMDPFIEGYKWSPFHASMIIYMQEMLIEQLPEGYFLEAETTLYIDDGIFAHPATYIPDVSLLELGNKPGKSIGLADTITPPTERRSNEATKVRSLRIMDTKHRELITSIELLSPTNKRGLGLEKYQSKREHFLLTDVNLVEIDLLRGGRRPDVTTKSKSPYLIQVTDRGTNETLEWSVALFEILPTIPIPLLPGVPPLVLNIQVLFERVYRFSSLPRTLSYDIVDLQPSLTNDQELAKLKTYLVNAGE